LYQTAQKQLTLFHAICVLHLLALLGFGLVTQSHYKGQSFNHWLTLNLLHVLVGTAIAVLAIYILATAPTFGSQPECNAGTVYVVFGVSIHAIDVVFRYLVLAGVVALLVAGGLSLLCMGCWCGDLIRSGVTWANEDGRALEPIIRQFRTSDPARRRDILSGQLARTAGTVAVHIYMIATLEQTISRNQVSPEEAEWTFGQVLAIFVLLGLAVEVMNIMLASSHSQRTELVSNAEEPEPFSGVVMDDIRPR
jgi:hypothetical protein